MNRTERITFFVGLTVFIAGNFLGWLVTHNHIEVIVCDLIANVCFVPLLIAALRKRKKIRHELFVIETKIIVLQSLQDYVKPECLR